MKKIVAIFLVLLLLFSFAGCDTAKIEVGAENEVAYFNRGTLTPTILLKGETDTKVEDEYFFGKLVKAIEGKATVDPVCECQPIYNVGIDKYTFGLHSHGITISSPMGKNIKGTNIFAVECTEEEIRELFIILANIDSTADAPIYPGLPDISEDPMKGIEIYCWQDGDEWKCGGTVGTNRMKTDEEIRALQVVTIPQMKRILEQKGLTDCFHVMLVDLSGDEVVYLDVEENMTQIATLEMQLGKTE